MNEEAYRSKVASVFSSMHTSVVVASSRMLTELKRYNYVTPTNFLELVKVSRSELAWPTRTRSWLPLRITWWELPLVRLTLSIPIVS